MRLYVYQSEIIRFSEWGYTFLRLRLYIYQSETIRFTEWIYIFIKMKQSQIRLHNQWNEWLSCHLYWRTFENALSKRNWLRCLFHLNCVFLTQFHDTKKFHIFHFCESLVKVKLYGWITYSFTIYRFILWICTFHGVWSSRSTGSYPNCV